MHPITCLAVALGGAALASHAFAAPAPAAAPDAEAASQDLLQIYEEFCLDRFPNDAALQAGIAAHHLVPADKDAAASALLGRPGTAWTGTIAGGGFAVAITAPPSRGCAVTGAGLDDESVQTQFALTVRLYATNHEYGALNEPPVMHASIAGKPARLQLIEAAPGGYPRQGFVNRAIDNGNGTADVRMTREFAPVGK